MVEFLTGQTANAYCPARSNPSLELEAKLTDREIRSDYGSDRQRASRRNSFNSNTCVDSDAVRYPPLAHEKDRHQEWVG